VLDFIDDQHAHGMEVGDVEHVADHLVQATARPGIVPDVIGPQQAIDGLEEADAQLLWRTLERTIQLQPDDLVKAVRCLMINNFRIKVQETLNRPALAHPRTANQGHTGGG